MENSVWHKRRTATGAALAGTTAVDILQEALDYQRAFILHPGKRKTVCSERRAGKSFALALALVDKCINLTKAKCAYLNLTNDACRATMWTDIFESIFLKYNIKAVLNSKLEIVFPNGSIIYLRGCDSSPQLMNRLRGQSFNLVVIDEAQSFTQDLKETIFSVLKMTLAQTGASLILAGTPGAKLGTNYWWNIHKADSKETEWEKFRFHWADNTKIDPKCGLRVCDSINADVAADIERDPDIVKTPQFRREVLGEWVLDDIDRIYRYEPSINDCEMPSIEFLSAARFLLGFDIGYHPDPSTLVVCCWNTRKEQNLYVIHSEVCPKMITEQLAMRIKTLDRQYKFSWIVGDSQNLNIIHDLNETYGIATVKADKPGKEAHMMMLNSDFITNRVRIVADRCPGLGEELQNVIWSAKRLREDNKRVEDPRIHNDLTDALLYAHHFSRHHWYKPPKLDKNPLPDNSEETQRYINAVIRRHKERREIDFALPNETGDGIRHKLY